MPPLAIFVVNLVQIKTKEQVGVSLGAEFHVSDGRSSVLGSPTRREPQLRTIQSISSNAEDSKKATQRGRRNARQVRKTEGETSLLCQMETGTNQKQSALRVGAKREI